MGMGDERGSGDDVIHGFAISIAMESINEEAESGMGGFTDEGGGFCEAGENVALTPVEELNGNSEVMQRGLIAGHAGEVEELLPRGITGESVGNLAGAAGAEDNEREAGVVCAAAGGGNVRGEGIVVNVRACHFEGSGQETVGGAAGERRGGQLCAHGCKLIIR